MHAHTLHTTFFRRSRIRFIIVPDMLKNAPMFKRIDPKFKVSTRRDSFPSTHAGTRLKCYV